ncbi:MAG: FtsQ-type POTRA domain-containing protein [Nitrospirota bacterium]|nr:FtsQ-type POTRA domain-containing protein [Nitrospirota bacterium]
MIGARSKKRVPRNQRRPDPVTARTAARVRLRRTLKHIMLTVLLSGLLGGLGYAYHTALGTGLLDVKHVQFAGNARIPEEKLLARLQLPTGARLPGLDLEAVSRSVLTHPWVERVSVRRLYPSTLTIRVWERTPRAVLLDGTGQPHLMVDAEGMVLGRPEEGSHRLPQLSGIVIKGVVTGDRVDLQQVTVGLEVASAYGRPGGRVDVADPRDPLLLADGMRVRVGDAGGYHWRLERLARLREELHRMGGKQGTEVDLRYDDRVVARPL